jgi:hypothetical protein
VGAEAALWIFLLAAVVERRAETTPIYLPHSVSIVRADGETSKGMCLPYFVWNSLPLVCARGTATAVQPFCFRKRPSLIHALLTSRCFC